MKTGAFSRLSVEVHFQVPTSFPATLAIHRDGSGAKGSDFKPGVGSECPTVQVLSMANTKPFPSRSEKY